MLLFDEELLLTSPKVAVFGEVDLGGLCVREDKRASAFDEIEVNIAHLLTFHPEEE